MDLEVRMKFAPVTLALATAIAAGATVTPAFAYDRYGDRYDSRYDNNWNRREYYEDACQQEKRKRRNTGAVVGGLAGAVLGSQVAGHGAKTEGAVVGGVAGAVVGANVGRSSAKNSWACDRQGAYFRYDQTYPYRSSYYRADYRGRYNDDWYERNRCRWAPDYRGGYMRVCPDRYDHDRYRVTD
jgi:hypothetical protein